MLEENKIRFEINLEAAQKSQFENQLEAARSGEERNRRPERHLACRSFEIHPFGAS